MHITVTKALAEEIGLSKFEAVGLSEGSWSWKGEATIHLYRLPKEQKDYLRKLLEKNAHLKGAKLLLKDMDTWDAAVKGGVGQVRPRKVKHFSDLLTEYIARSPGHRLYQKWGQGENGWLAYFTTKVEYEDETDRHGERVPAHVVMSLAWESVAGKVQRTETFWREDVAGMTVSESLLRKGYVVETKELRQEYLEDLEKLKTVAPQVGKQYWATGVATTDVPDVEDEKTGDSDSRYRPETLHMQRHGERSRVVVDVFGKVDSRERHVNMTWWRHHTDDEFDAVELQEVEVEVPVHPFVVVFDLARHQRLKLHVRFMEEYMYDRALSEKLILESSLKNLVLMLMESKAGMFTDIVRGKSGGLVTMLAGPPGTGKTLTAEVYAEAEGRALYSVQCSQLGSDPDTLEQNLHMVFNRAQRWNAVLLLDEADVYLSQRGSDFHRNAIVGVFLRVLEYQQTTMFVTTNRPDDIDDAVLSRCVARLSYQRPSEALQMGIWKVLSESSNIPLTPQERTKIVRKYPDLTGRDIKNLLKLAWLYRQHMASQDGKKATALTLEDVTAVRMFNPTIQERRHAD